MGRGYAGDDFRRTPGGGPVSDDGLLVLIVDDSPRNLKLARDVLRAAGFRTLEAETAAEGITIAAEYVPDVILMDLRLPDMDGMEAARRLAAGERTARIPVVALSAGALGRDDDPTLTAGFAGFLEKPIGVHEFPGQVPALLRPG